MSIFAAGIVAPTDSSAQDYSRGELIPETVALRHGLHRRWVSQIQMDVARDRLTFATLDREVLCVQTRNGLTQTLEAESGNSRWYAQIGKSGYPSSELAANEEYVAATNGATLYVLDLQTGKPVFQKKLDSVPYAAPVLDKERVYVPLFNGMIASYTLAKPKQDPRRFQSVGRIVAQPILTPKSLAWGTMRGFAYATDPGKTNVRFQLETKGEIVSPLAYRAGVIYVTSLDGYAYALDEDTGQTIWRFSAGRPIPHEPVVIDESVYLFPEGGGMFAVSASRGTELWRRPNIKQFLAHRRIDPKYPEIASAMYVADASGRLLTLDPDTGGLLDTLDTQLLPIKMTNTLNDRLYLATATGMIQCLHHPDIIEPLWHTSPADEAAETTPTPSRRSPGGEASADEPAGDEGEMPAEEAPAEEAPTEGEAPAADPFDESAPAAEEAPAEEPAAEPTAASPMP